MYVRFCGCTRCKCLIFTCSRILIWDQNLMLANLDGCASNIKWDLSWPLENISYFVRVDMRMKIFWSGYISVIIWSAKVVASFVVVSGVCSKCVNIRRSITHNCIEDFWGVNVNKVERSAKLDRRSIIWLVSFTRTEYMHICRCYLLSSSFCCNPNIL